MLAPVRRGGDVSAEEVYPLTYANTAFLSSGGACFKFAKAQSEKKKAEEMAEKNAERKLNYRFEIIKTFITIGATLLVEHFTEIFNFLCNLLHRLFS